MSSSGIECGIYYKAFGTTTWIDITPYIDSDSLPEFNPTIEKQFYEFSLKLNAPTDSLGNYIMITDKDEIAITENRQRLRIFGDICLGRPVNRQIFVHYWGSSQTETVMSFQLICRQRNFSLGEMTLSTKTIQNLSEILNLIFSDENILLGNLGGVKSNGVIIPKYELDSALDIEINPVEFVGEAVEVLNSLMDLIGYQYYIKNICEPDSTNLLNTFNTVVICDRTGTPNISSDWKNGINRGTIDDGVIVNPFYDSNLSEECQYMPCEIDFAYECNSDVLQNYTKLLAYILSNNNRLDRFEKKQHDDQDTFSVGKALDIVYVARLVNTYVGAVADTNNFDIDSDIATLIQYDSDRLTDNGLGTALVCRIVSNSVEYFREFTILGNTITLTAGTPQTPSIDGSISTLTEGDIFELINGYDVLEEGEESYPDDGDGYIIKHINPTEDCYFKFFQYDRPNEDDIIVCYFYKIEENNQILKYWDSIQKYSQGFKRLEIPNACTVEDLERITAQLRNRKEPLETLTFTSYRKNILLPNTRLKVDLLPLIQDNLFVIDNNCKFINPYSPYYDKPLIEQKVKMASYIDNLEYELSKIKRRKEVKETKVAQNLKERINFDLYLSFNFDELPITAELPDGPRAFYKFAGIGDVHDYTENGYDGSIYYNLSYNWIDNVNGFSTSTNFAFTPHYGRFETPNALINGLGDLTIHVIVKVNSFNPSYNSIWDDNDTLGFLSQDIKFDGNMISNWVQGSYSFAFDPDFHGFLDGNFHSWTFWRRTNGTYGAYYDGVPVMANPSWTPAWTGVISTVGCLGFGSSGDGSMPPTSSSRNLKGSIRRIVVYDRVLSTFEVMKLNLYLNSLA